MPPLKPASMYASKPATSFDPPSGVRLKSVGHLSSTDGEIEYFLRISTCSSSRISEQGPSPSSSSNNQRRYCLKEAIGTASLLASGTSPQDVTEDEKRSPRRRRGLMRTPTNEAEKTGRLDRLFILLSWKGKILRRAEIIITPSGLYIQNSTPSAKPKKER